MLAAVKIPATPEYITLWCIIFSRRVWASCTLRPSMVTWASCSCCCRRKQIRMQRERMGWCLCTLPRITIRWMWWSCCSRAVLPRNKWQRSVSWLTSWTLLIYRVSPGLIRWIMLLSTISFEVTFNVMHYHDCESFEALSEIMFIWCCFVCTYVTRLCFGGVIIVWLWWCEYVVILLMWICWYDYTSITWCWYIINTEFWLCWLYGYSCLLYLMWLNDVLLFSTEWLHSIAHSIQEKVCRGNNCVAWTQCLSKCRIQSKHLLFSRYLICFLLSLVFSLFNTLTMRAY